MCTLRACQSGPVLCSAPELNTSTIKLNLTWTVNSILFKGTCIGKMSTLLKKKSHTLLTRATSFTSPLHCRHVCVVDNNCLIM